MILLFSHNRFQWAFLQIEQLLSLLREKEILDRLGKLPKDLERAYDEIYKGMSEHEKQITDRVFRWIMCACKPLTTAELLPAIAQDGESDTIMPLEDLDEELALEYCHNLFVVDPVREVWVPSHLSVMEYFENACSQSNANCFVASVCLVLLNNAVLYDREKTWIKYSEYKSSGEDISPKRFEDPTQNQGFDHLSRYVRHHWVNHTQRSAGAHNMERLSILLSQFLGQPKDSSLAYQSWLTMLSEENPRRDTPNTSIFTTHFRFRDLSPKVMSSFAFCAFKLEIILPDWDGSDWMKSPVKTDSGYNYLDLVVISGASVTCRNLIKAGVEVDATSAENGSALDVACAWGNEEIVKILVEEGGANVNMQMEYSLYGSALAAACLNEQIEIVKFLIKEGANVDMQLEYGRYGSVLAAACWVQKIKIVKYLIRERGANVNMQLENGDCGSALAAACWNGGIEIVEFLVREGAYMDMQLENGSFGSALAAACLSEKIEIVEFLVREGANVDMQLENVNCGSALAAACWSEKIEIVEFLIREGANVNMQVEYGNYGSALAAACWNGKIEIVEFLIREGGANVNMQLENGAYGSALAAACSRTLKKWVKRLFKGSSADNVELEHGVKIRDVMEPWEKRQFEVVKFLIIEAGAEANMPLKCGPYANALEAAGNE